MKVTSKGTDMFGKLFGSEALCRRAMIGLAVLLLTQVAVTLAAGPEFEINFTRSVSSTPYTGRVYVVLTRDTAQEPLEAVNWFQREPLIARDVTAWRPGDKLQVKADDCLAYPDPLAELPAGRYRARAVLNLNNRSHDVISAPGNGISRAITFTHEPEDPEAIRFVINDTIERPRLADSKHVKYVRLKSERLSEFHDRFVHLRAAALLPDAYHEEKGERFPTVYVISGFGDTIYDAEQYHFMWGHLLGSVGFDAVVMFIDADWVTGHHVWADSDNNGPWGAALVHELIPYLEKRFRLIPDVEARYLTGISSGGWSSLWLQITYPDTFGAVWSMSPDPVDFRAFQHVNIYEPDANMLFGEDGEPRMFSRKGLFGPPIELKDFVHKEDVLGRGGQMQSFDAVFSPRGKDGAPGRLFDHETGRMDPAVAEAWRRYDITHILKTNWELLGPKLTGKLYLYCGDRDDFFLERAFYLLRDTLKELKSDAFIRVVPGGGHMLPPMTLLKAARQMKERFRIHYLREVPDPQEQRDEKTERGVAWQMSAMAGACRARHFAPMLDTCNLRRERLSCNRTAA